MAHIVFFLYKRSVRLPVLKLRLKTHHRLDSNDSEVYLSICCHLHTLQKSIQNRNLLVWCHRKRGSFPGINKLLVHSCRAVKYIPFGWNILETNRTVGGLFGYSSVNSMVSLKVPGIKKKRQSINWDALTKNSALQ